MRGEDKFRGRIGRGRERRDKTIVKRCSSYSNTVLPLFLHAQCSINMACDLCILIMHLSIVCPTSPPWGHTGTWWGFVKVNMYFALTLGQNSSVLCPTLALNCEGLHRKWSNAVSY